MIVLLLEFTEIWVVKNDVTSRFSIVVLPPSISRPLSEASDPPLMTTSSPPPSIVTSEAVIFSSVMGTIVIE